MLFRSGSAPKVNRVVLALGAPGGESNIPNQITSTDTWQIRPAYEYLTGVDTDGKDVQQKVPQLATEWSLEPDGKSYRFKLRKGVQFHYGMGEFTAQDVVFAWQHMIAPESKHPHTPRYRTTIEDVQVVNDYEVVIKNKQADLAFIWALGEMEGGFEIISKKDFDAHGGKFPALTERPLAGTGPYEIGRAHV